jgi:outer membrane immunogenic protein
MKKLLLSGVVLTALALPALAADLPRKAPAYQPPPPPPVYSWTGFYVGLNAGVHCFAEKDINVASVGVFNPPGFNPDIMNQAAAGATTSLSSSGNDRCGGIGGGQIGYNWQFSNWLIGAEADIQGITGSLDATATTAVIANNGLPIDTHIDASKRVEWLGTLRGRLGWLATPTVLLYATGGLAYGGVKSEISITQTHLVSDTFGSLAADFSETRVGWTAGGGVEWMLAPNWTARAEYLYYDLGDVSYNGGTLSAAFTNGFVRYGISPDVDTRFNGHIARLGVNYKF